MKARGLQEAAADERRKMGEDVKALPWPSGVESLENSALPADQLVAEWTGRLDKAEQAVEQAEERLRTAQSEVSTLENRLATLLAGRSVPTLSQLDQDRQRRNFGWKAVRGAWLEGDLESMEIREFLQQPGDGPSLAKAYEDSVESGVAIAHERSPWKTTHDDLRLAVDASPGGCDRRGVVRCPLTIYAERVGFVRPGVQVSGAYEKT